MTNKASAPSAALLALALVLSLAGVSHAANSNIWPTTTAQQAIPGDTQRASTQVVPSDQLNDADRAVSEPAQTVQSTTVMAPTSQPDTQGQSVVPVVARSDEGSGSDTSSLIGKIFIAFGTLLTVGSAASRMLMG